MTANLGHLNETERARCLLQESEARYRALVEQLPVVAYTATLDEPSAVLYVSPQIEALLGYTPPELRRNDGIWPDRIHPEERERVLAELRTCRISGRPLSTEYRFRRRDDRIIWVRDTATVVRDNAGQLLCLQGVMQDITDYKRAERRLADAQALAHVGSWEWDIVADQFAWSDEHYRIFGLEPRAAPVTLATILEYVHPADRPGVERYAVEARAGTQPTAHQFRVVRPDGTERVVEARGKLELDETGRPVRMYGTAQDVTERTRAERELRRAQDEARQIFEYASIGIFRAARDGRILLANPAFARMLGYDTPAELGALDLARDVYFDPRQREALIAQYESSRTPWTLEILWKKRDGTPFWVLLNAHAVRDGAGRTAYFEGFAQDITERREAQQELARSRRRLRELAARREAVRETERKIMAREIHDELGQALTALRMDLARLRQRLPPAARDLAPRTDVMTGIVDHLVETVRRIATELRPPILDDFGLVAAIEWQAEETAARAGFRCALDLPTEVRLDDGRATTVFRICQEALTNAARHAQATSVQVVLRATPRELVLKVLDDGRGITLAELADQRAIGLLGMRERALAWGGTLDVYALAPAGTAVELRLPRAGGDGEDGTQ